MTDKQLAVFGKSPAIRAAAKSRLRGGSHAHKANRSKASRPKRRSNPGGEIIGYTLRNNAAGRSHMAKTKKTKKKNPSRGYGHSKMKANPARHRKHYRRNAATGGGGLVPMVTNAVFVVVGALASKLGAQAVLGSNNTGIIGYAGNLAIGAALYMLTEHVMKNRAASSGVIAGTLVQVLLRVINDYTPFGSYVSQLGMGDYQMQSFVTPQVLVDPYNSAQIMLPNGWGAPPPAAAALPAAAAAGGGPGGLAGTGSGYGDLYTGRGGLY